MLLHSNGSKRKFIFFHFPNHFDSFRSSVCLVSLINNNWAKQAVSSASGQIAGLAQRPPVELGPRQTLFRGHHLSIRYPIRFKYLSPFNWCIPYSYEPRDRTYSFDKIKSIIVLFRLHICVGRSWILSPVDFPYFLSPFVWCAFFSLVSLCVFIFNISFYSCCSIFAFEI